MIYTMSQTPTETVLVARVDVWRTLLDIQSLPPGSSISHVKQPGERFAQNEWIDITGRITKAVDGKEDSEAVRITFERDFASQLVDAARV